MMVWKTTNYLALAICLIGSLASAHSPAEARAITALVHAGQAAPQTAAPAQTVRPVGAIKNVSGNTITLTPDSGADVTILVQESARILRVDPGQKDLKTAVPIHIEDLQPGDRILVFAKAVADGKPVEASIVVAMKSADVEAKQQQERQEWQRGVSGLVSAVDPTAGTITISSAASGPSAAGAASKTTVRTAKTSVIRRYAPDSVKFSDAKLSSLDQIKPGDQLRARGKRSGDGGEFAADQIVCGSFQNIAGAITVVDASANTIRVADLISKKPVLVKIAADSQLHKLPPEMAQHIAMRLKGGADSNASSGAPGNSDGAPTGAHGGSSAQGATQSPIGPGGASQNRSAAFQQFVNRMPQSPLSDFKKGDVVMIVSTEGSVPGEVTAITVLGGVEPLLSAAPHGGQAMTLSPWNIGSSGGGETEAGTP
jgi:hypothetical protein